MSMCNFCGDYSIWNLSFLLYSFTFLDLTIKADGKNLLQIWALKYLLEWKQNITKDKQEKLRDEITCWSHVCRVPKRRNLSSSDTWCFHYNLFPSLWNLSYITLFFSFLPKQNCRVNHRDNFWLLMKPTLHPLSKPWLWQPAVRTTISGFPSKMLQKLKHFQNNQCFKLHKNRK